MTSRPTTPQEAVLRRVLVVEVVGLEVRVNGETVCIAPDERVRDLVAEHYLAMKTERELA